MSPDDETPIGENETASDRVEQWIANAQKGAPEALGRLLEACRHYLMLVANEELKTDLQGKFGASDVVQETLLEAQRDFGRFRGHSERELLAWLRRILLHNLLNHERQFTHVQKRSVKREVDPEIEDVKNRSSGGGTPSQHAMADEESSLLAAAMGRLPEEYRRVIELRNREGLSFADIGQRLNRSADAARMLWSRAFEALARELDDMMR